MIVIGFWGDSWGQCTTLRLVNRFGKTVGPQRGTKGAHKGEPRGLGNQRTRELGETLGTKIWGLGGTKGDTWGTN